MQVEELSILADIPSEGEETLDELSTTPVEKPVVEEPAEKGENTPSKEPDDYKERTSKRVQQLLKERAEERERNDALEARLGELEKSTANEDISIPDRWSELFSTGDAEQDKKAYQSWKTMNDEEKESWKSEVINELRNEEAKAAQEAEEYTKAYDAQMDELEASGKIFDRNELMAFVAKRPIFRQDGQPDFETSLELMEMQKPKLNIDARKKLVTVTPKSVAPTSGYKTPADLKGGWNSI